ncbi:hypothetical protein B0J14DRAFT_598878 [Halenospora varia]|nr:hypothetical protein B0J14DRAFT_598878 [Halenospora varia]
MANIADLLSQYGLLKQMAHFLSALDLFHLALTNPVLYTLICKSKTTFDRLKSVALCDGHGLKMRQEFGGIYELRAEDFAWREGRRARYDEELEVRVWNLTCDSTNGLSCLRCRVNVCEECRYVPRVRDTPRMYSLPRQHHLAYPRPNNIIFFCAGCDVEVERNLPLSLSEYCDCDQYKRWICLPCKVKEDQIYSKYLETRAKGDREWAGDLEEGMWYHGVVEHIAFWCPCGERAPRGGNIRCSWCKRRHNLNTWKDGDPDWIPFFDEDPCYPRFAVDNMGDQIMYPRLEYNGPIF